MQADRIVEKILEDARSQVRQIELETSNEIDELKKQVASEIKSRDKEVAKAVATYKQKVENNYAILSKIDSSKMILAKKQEILQQVKYEVAKKIDSLDKKSLLKFVEKLIKKNAKKGDTVSVMFSNLTLSDIKKLAIVKDLNLKIVKGTDLGIVISNDDFDKNLSLQNLVQDAFDMHKNNIIDLLFV